VARIRTIKPEFFLHEGLAELTPLHRLLFIGLWTLADKRGVLEDRPRKIKAALFPWEDCDVDAMLWDLADIGLVKRFEGLNAHGEMTDAISIVAFTRHQRPHPKESESDLPTMDGPVSREKKRQAGKGFSSIPSSPAGKGREGKEILDSGKETSANAVAAVGGMAAPPSFLAGAHPGRRAEDRTNPNDTIRDKLEKIWTQKRGRPPSPGWWSDRAFRPAFEAAGGDGAEVLRVFAAALDREFPLLTRLSDLAKHWDAYAATRMPERRGGPNARATQSDKDWGDVAPQEDTHELFESGVG
jgi:hypothetical protein